MILTRMNASAIFAIIVLLLITLPHGVAGLRATPAQIVMPLESDGSFSVRVLDAQPHDIVVAIEGDLATTATVDVLAPHPEGGTAITGHITLPTDLTPGDHTQQLVIALAAPEGTGTVGARAEIAIPIIVRVPYPDAYLVANWDAQPDAGAGTGRITVTLENRGSVTVTPRIATVTITDGDLTADPIPLTVGPIAPRAFARAEAIAFPPEDRPGVYTATLRVAYADRELVESLPVTIGAPRIAITRVSYDIAEQGDIIPIDIAGDIVWNRAMMATVSVYLDGTLAANEQVAFAPGAYTHRFYTQVPVDTSRPTVVRAVVTVGDAHAERTENIPPRTAATAPSSRTLLILLAVIVIIVLSILVLFLWRRKRKPPLSSTVVASKPPSTNTPSVENWQPTTPKLEGL